MHTLAPGYRALVLGSSGAIGAALCEALAADPRCGGVTGLSRHSVPAFQLESEDSLASAASALQANAPFALVVVATGILQVGGQAPEKRLADMNAANLTRLFAVNAAGPALAIKHFHTLLPLQERCLLAVLSARVGSIGDNRLGGWYGYRASKAALNMLLKTAAIEVARKRPQAVLAALHPGTVRSALSAPIIGTAPAHSPALAAQHLLGVLDRLHTSGGFHAWDASPIAW